MQAIILIGLVAAVLALAAVLVIAGRARARQRRRATARWEHYRHLDSAGSHWEIGVHYVTPDGQTLYQRSALHAVPVGTSIGDLLELEAEAIARAAELNTGDT